MDDTEDILTYVEDLGITFPIFQDHARESVQSYPSEAPFPTGMFPQDWIINSDGIIIYHNNKLEMEAIQEILEAELN